MQEKIVDLMREKFGILANPKNKKLVITDKDTLFSTYQKVAKYLYANHIVTAEDYLKVANYELRKANWTMYQKSDLRQIATAELPDRLVSAIQYQTKNVKHGDSRDWQKHIFIMDCKSGKHLLGKFKYCLFCVSPNGVFKSKDIRRTFHFTSFRDYAIVVINFPASYGYMVLENDFSKKFSHDDSEITQQFFKSSMFKALFNPAMTKMKFARSYPRLPSILERVKYATSVDQKECKNIDKWDGESTMATLPDNSYLFDCCIEEHVGYYIPSKVDDFVQYNIDELAEVTLPNEKNKFFMWKNDVGRLAFREQYVKLLKYYLQATQNIILQFDHDTEMQNKLEHARFFEEKKNIKLETQREMKRLGNSLNDKFSHVEIDNDVDLNKLNDIKDELKATIAFLPKADNGQKAILRFRKLRNHKALGIFTPVNNTVAVDFRSNANGKIEKASEAESELLGNIGLQSLIHEYGHFLDYNTKCNAPTLSQDADFESILFNVQSLLDASGLVNLSVLQYLKLPSEIFARAFEIYVSQCGLRNSFIKSTNQLSNASSINFAYSCFDDQTREMISSYFDKKFPLLRKQIGVYNQSVKANKQINLKATVKHVAEKQKKQHKQADVITDYVATKQLSLF